MAGVYIILIFTVYPKIIYTFLSLPALPLLELLLHTPIKKFCMRTSIKCDMDMMDLVEEVSQEQEQEEFEEHSLIC